MSTEHTISILCDLSKSEFPSILSQNVLLYFLQATLCKTEYQKGARYPQTQNKVQLHSKQRIDLLSYF